MKIINDLYFIAFEAKLLCLDKTRLFFIIKKLFDNYLLEFIPTKCCHLFEDRQLRLKFKLYNK